MAFGRCDMRLPRLTMSAARVRNLRSKTLVIALALPMVLGCSNAKSALKQANPATAKVVIASARSGDTIRLARGDYYGITVKDRTFAPALTIEAGDARLTDARLDNIDGLVIQGGTYLPLRRDRQGGGEAFGEALRMNNVRNVKVRGATFVGPGSPSATAQTEFGEGQGLRVIGGQNIEVVESRFEGFKRGLGLRLVDGFRVAGNTFLDMRSDGLNAALSRNGLIEANNCAGTRIRDTEHPDCIQLWSAPNTKPTADIVIRRNRIEGSTQGIGLYNHVRGGVDDGGFDRIVIEDNEIKVSRANAIMLVSGRESVVRNNKVSTAPGARFQASIRVTGGTVRQCGNIVGEGAGRAAKTDSAC